MERLDQEMMMKGDWDGKISPELEAKIRARERGEQAETQEGKLDPEDEEDDSGLRQERQMPAAAPSDEALGNGKLE